MRRAAAIALVLVAFAAGCGGDDETTTTSTSTTSTAGATGASGEDEDVGVVSNTVEVAITDGKLTPSNADPGSLLPGERITSTAKAGEVTFELTNETSEPQTIVFNELGKEEPLAEDLAPGDSATATVTVSSGFYEYYSDDEAVQEAGMQAQLEVVD